MKRILFISVATAAWSYGQTVSFPSTGAASVSGNPNQDANWTVESHISDEPGTGQAAIVKTPLPGGWVTPDSGSAWISIQPDQSNATRPGTCCADGALYRVKFNVTDPTKASFKIKIAADEVITMHLNGTYEDDNSIVYSTVGPTYNNPSTITVTQGVPYTDPGGYIHVPRFVAGVNMLEIEVDNYSGGPTGLYISSVPSAAVAPSTYTNTATSISGANSVPDPADSASGQFYDTEVDFRLGGPIQLGLARFYSSQLSSSGVSSALGANWMSTYDVSALMNGPKAQVLLFGGRVITFNNAGGKWQLVSPLTRDYQFAAVSGGFQFMDPSVQKIYSFNSTGALTKIQDRNGNALTITPGSNGPVKVADGMGRTLTLTYNGSQLASVQDQSGRTVSYTYSGGLLASVTDPAKAVTNYVYSTVGSKTGLLVKETLPLGNAPVTQTYDATGRLITQSGTTNNMSKISYDGLGGTTIVDAAGQTTSHRNDATGNVMQIIDVMGGVETMTYDGSHRRITNSDRAGGTLQYVYDNSSGEIAAVTDKNGNTTSYTFTPQTSTPQTSGPFTFYDMSGITYPDSSRANLTYDPAGNLATVTTPDGATTSLGYDDKGRVTQVTNPLGNSTAYNWNADGTVASVQDALGSTTKYEYDAMKRVVKATDPNGRIEQYSYDAAGRETTNLFAGQAPWLAHFNANGQIDTLTNPLDAKFAFTFSPAGLLDTQTDPLKNAITFSYDGLNQIKKVQLATGEAIMYTRDALGRIVGTADNSGPLLQYGYDPEGRITSQTDATGLTTTFTYTKSGELASIATPTGSTLAFDYDALGNLITRTSPMGDQYRLTYDTGGRALTITGPGGFSTAISRDAMGMPASFTSANGHIWTMTYDALERITSMTDPLGNVTNYSYEGARISKIDLPLGSVTFAYDSLGHVTKSEYSDRTVVNATFNAMGQILTSDHLAIERDVMGQMTKVNGIAITRDAGGRPVSMAYAKDKAIAYTYDKSGRVDSVSDWTGGKMTITYDAASRRTAQTLPNGVSTKYSYDADGRRNSILYGALGSIALTYDADGKITSADRNLPIAPALQDNTDQFSFNEAGQLTTATYDSMGRVTSQGSRIFTWDLATQLTSFTDPVNSGTMSYDGALGEMYSSTASGAAQTFVFNYAMEYPALSIVRQGSDDQRYYVYLPNGELLYSIDAKDGSRRFYHFDEMGNTAFLTDDGGAVSDSYAITPYGEVVDHVGTSINPFTWQGQFGTMQEADGLYYMRSRHYDSKAARFLSPDPLMDSEPQTSEPYAYARGNPMLYTDPFGAGWFDGITSAISNSVNAVKTGVSNAAKAVSNAVSSAAKAVTNVIQKVTTPQVQPAVKTPAKTVPPASPIVLKAPAMPIPSAVVSNDGATLQRLVTQGLITNDGATLILQLEGVVSNDGGTLVGLSQLISQDGNGLRSLIGLIGQDGNGLAQWAKLIGQDGNGLLSVQKLISQDGNSLLAKQMLIGQDGNGLISNGASGLTQGASLGGYGLNAASLAPRSYSLTSFDAPKPKNNKN